jgi:hypothetical protein
MSRTMKPAVKLLRHELVVDTLAALRKQGLSYEQTLQYVGLECRVDASNVRKWVDGASPVGNNVASLVGLHTANAPTPKYGFRYRDIGPNRESQAIVLFLLKPKEPLVPEARVYPEPPVQDNRFEGLLGLFLGLAIGAFLGFLIAAYVR